MIAILVQAIYQFHQFGYSSTTSYFRPNLTHLIVFATRRRVQNQCQKFLLQKFLLFNHLNRMQGAAQLYFS
jgi:hypothetical protein